MSRSSLLSGHTESQAHSQGRAAPSTPSRGRYSGGASSAPAFEGVGGVGGAAGTSPASQYGAVESDAERAASRGSGGAGSVLGGANGAEAASNASSSMAPLVWNDLNSRRQTNFEAEGIKEAK